jgi:O-antigen/teichoic acid export membrane protein
MASCRAARERRAVGLARTVAWNTGIQVTGRAVGMSVSVLLTAILTRHLGLATYGQMVAASTYVALFTILGDAGIYLVAVRRAAQEPDRRAAILGNALGLRLALALVPLALGYLLVQFIPSERFPTYVPAVKLAVAVLALNGYVTLLNQFMIAVFRLHLRMDLAVLGETIARLVALAGTLVVVAIHGGLIAAILALLGGTVANFLFAWTISRRFETFRPQFDPVLVRAMLHESAVLMVVTLLGLVHFKVDTLMLSLMKSAEDVGVYGVAYKAHEVLITFPGLFVGLLYPLFSRFASEDPVRLQQIFRRTFDVLLTTALAAALLVFVLAPDLAALLGAAAAVRPMRVLAFALPPVFLGLGLTHLLLAEARQRWLVPLYATLVIVNVALNWMAIQRWSYMGAAAVTVATESLSVAILVTYWVGRRHWRLLSRSVLAVPLAVTVAAVATTVLRHYGGDTTAVTIPVRIVRLALAGSATALVYVGGVLALRIVPLADIRELLRRGGPPAQPGEL